MRWVRLGLCPLVLVLAACSTTGHLGIVTKDVDDSAALLRSGSNFEEIGPATGQACRYFFLAVVPWGASDFRTAVDNALAESGGDAMIDVEVESFLYGIFPIYNVWSVTCTNVKGTAVRINGDAADRSVRKF